MRDRLGICQWFHFEDEATLARSVALQRELGVRHLRTGISWADSLRPGGRAWNRRLLDALAEFEVVWHVPPSLGEAPVRPPRLRAGLSHPRRRPAGLRRAG